MNDTAISQGPTDLFLAFIMGCSPRRGYGEKDRADAGISSLVARPTLLVTVGS